MHFLILQSEAQKYRSLLLQISSALFSFYLHFPAGHSQKIFPPQSPHASSTKRRSYASICDPDKQRTPLVPVKLTVHLGGVSLWVDCVKGSVPSTNKTACCGSAQCNFAAGRAKIYGPSGGNGICGLSTYNPISNTGIIDSLRIDVVSIESATNGRAVTVPKFIFLCGSVCVTVYIRNIGISS